MDQNSMVFWWPKIEYIDIPKPKTIIIWTGHRALQEMLDGRKLPSYLEKFILLAADELGFPLFVRTDLASGKHDWENSCFVTEREKIFSHIIRVVEFNSFRREVPFLQVGDERRTMFVL